MTSANGVTATSVFDQSGRKLRDVVADPDDAEKSVTDARGNQTQQVQTGTGVTTTSTYGYDLANRLISSNVTNNAVNPLSTGATYAYNAQGQRVTRVEDEVVTHFYYTGSALLFTTVNEYVLQTQNILDPSGTIVASKRFEGQAETGQDPYAEDYFFYRYDIRGSVTTIVDGEGAVVKSYDYDEFGVTTSTGDAFFNEVTFTGSIADASGLLYMNARYYNPSTARFLSQDTYTGSAFDPWTQHLYAYCNNNPVNMIDPTGHVAVYMTLLNDGNDGTVTPEPEYITDQGDESIGELPFGWRGNVAQNGCGPVALYNVLIAAGKNPGTFEELNASYNEGCITSFWTHLFGGCLGMNPLALEGILWGEFGTENFNCHVLSSQTEYDAIIVLYLYINSERKPSGHYFAGIAHTPGKYTLYNIDGGDSTGPYDMKELRAYALNKGLVIGTWGITFDGNNAGKKGALTWENGR